MSHIGKKPINVPDGVEINISGTNEVTVKGKLGELHQTFNADLLINKINTNYSTKGTNERLQILIDKLEDMGGFIEYIDTEEANTCLIALYPNQINDGFNYTHCEIHPTLLYGTLGSIIPFSDSNQFPRNLFSTGQSKQAISIYTTNFKNRMDTEGQIIFYGE